MGLFTRSVQPAETSTTLPIDVRGAGEGHKGVSEGTLPDEARKAADESRRRLGTTLPRIPESATTFHRGLEGASPRRVITLERLVRTAPFPDDTRAEILAAIPSLPQRKRVELEELCWYYITASFQNDVRYRQKSATMEMAQGIRTYSREEMGAIAESELARVTVQLTGGSSREDRQSVPEGMRNAKESG